VELAAWKDEAMRTLRAELAGDAHWGPKLRARTGKVHLAVFVEPWLSWLVEGSKTIESRFSVRRCVPFGRVEARDVVLLKASSGPVVGVCEVDKTWYFDTQEVPLTQIARRFGRAIGADAAFWKSVRHTRFVTLLEVREPRAIQPLSCPKRDRRGWVAFD
jgi:hypothetical protein